MSGLRFSSVSAVIFIIVLSSQHTKLSTVYIDGSAQLSEYLTFFYVEIKTTDVELNGFFLKECVSVKNLKVTEKSCLKGEKCRFALISFTKHSIHLTVFSYKSVKHLDRAEINRYTPTVKQKHLQANNCKGSFKPI